jgi:hypothetical protein
MVLGLVNQWLVIVILIFTTIIFDRKFLKIVRHPPDVRTEFSKWKGSYSNFVEFKKYQYNHVFWQASFQLSFSIFMFGLVTIARDFFIQIIGVLPWLVWVFCSVYPLAKFSLLIIPRASNFSINNMRTILLMEKNGSS